MRISVKVVLRFKADETLQVLPQPRLVLWFESGLAQGQIVRCSARCILQFVMSVAVLVFLFAQQLDEHIREDVNSLRYLALGGG